MNKFMNYFVIKREELSETIKGRNYCASDHRCLRNEFFEAQNLPPKKDQNKNVKK